MGGDDTIQARGGIGGGGEAIPLVRAAYTTARAMAPCADVAETAAAVSQDEPEPRAFFSGLGDFSG